MIYREAIDMAVNYTYLPITNKSVTMFEVMLWCEQRPGDGHFTMGGHGVFFEKEEDAIMFALAYKDNHDQGTN